MSDLVHPSVELQIVPRVRDLGGFQVQRVLPSSRRKMVGPFIFLDQMGPAILQPGEGVDVRPHPHIGLATVTYLSAGEFLHRDSVGSVVTIRPGDVNWMTAGKGIAHSERTPGCARPAGGPISGVQLWVALPKAHEETDPVFAHHDRATLPMVEDAGAQVRVVAGSFLGVQSPVRVLWETLLADVTLAAGAALPISAHHDERAIFLTHGQLEMGGQILNAGPLYVLKPGVAVDVRAVTPATFVLLGGEPMDGPRHIWWNFVSSSEERIEQARADWQAGRFRPIPGETERIDAPERG
ncbi:MAG: pirin family protein [Acidobacteria bacterium]|nr:pirin family protein [Acidobacteriota bacterium]